MCNLLTQIVEIIKNLFEFLVAYLVPVAPLFVLIGGLFALRKWSIQIRDKQADLVRYLICKVRDDDDIAMIMDIIDWNKGLDYQGVFSFDSSTIEKGKISDEHKKELENKTELFKKIDKTLAHFSYICYLKKRKALKKPDVIIFEYNLRRITDNIHIRNYLFSIYHWSKHLGVKSSFCYLIDYSIKKGYLTRDFKDKTSQNYKCFLG